MTTETKLETITRLKALLESGVKSSSIDGESADFDLVSVRRELMRLEREYGTRRKRSRVITPAMGRR